MSDDLAQKIAAIEANRDLFGDEQTDKLIATLRASVPLQPPKPAVAMQIDAKDATVSNVKMVNAEHYHEAPSDPEATKAESALRRYVRRLAGDCATLPLGMLDATDAVSNQGVKLAQVYIALNTTTHPDAQSRRDQRDDSPPLSALAAVNRSRCTMLLGAPGYGKSTFVNHLSATLAQAWLMPTAERPTQPLPEWTHGVLLPVRVILRDWVAQLDIASAQTIIKKASNQAVLLLKDFLRHHLAAWDCADALPLIWDMLDTGTALLLFDGFDEVVGAGLPIIAASISACMNVFATTRTLVTCRVLDYQEEPLRQLSAVTTHTLADLTDDQIQAFVAAWYHEYGTNREVLPHLIGQRTDSLQRAISARPELATLARSPLLLTIMAIVHASRGTLPDSEALLYKECIEILLLRWRQYDPDKVDLLDRLNIPKFGRKELFDLMARLGFLSHDQARRDASSDAPADLSKQTIIETLTESLKPYLANEEQRDHAATMILHAVARGNGVLLQRGPQVYAFPHRTFQEFLAGYHIAGQANKKSLVRERASQIHWHNALRLMVSFRVLESNDVEFPADLVELLSQRDALSQTLAGELLTIIGYENLVTYYATEPKLADELWQTTTTLMQTLATSRDSTRIPASQRVRAGFAHGTLAWGKTDQLTTPEPVYRVIDQRIPFAYLNTPHQHDEWWQMAVEQYWCHVPTGMFWFGQDQQNLHQVTLGYDFAIGRYPVTNAEYARFIADGGYTTQRWWTAQGWAFLQPGGHRYDDQSVAITLPRLWHHVAYNQPTQPVMAISWYEALAYCAWLSVQIGRPVRLPTSLEYERAARHTDQRPYPWGDTITPDHANYNATEIGRPSPLGCFPLGDAVCGASDLKGNVLEWLATAYEDDPNPAPLADADPNSVVLLVDGAYWRKSEQMFCGARYWSIPISGYNDFGFRLVSPCA